MSARTASGGRLLTGWAGDRMARTIDRRVPRLFRAVGELAP